MIRRPRKISHPVRATALALAVHLIFVLMFGISLQLEPKIVRASMVAPVQAMVIDQAAIEREKERQAEERQRRETEVKRQEEKKKEQQLEAKRQADLKKRQEVEKKRKIEEKRKSLAEEKRKSEEQRKIEVKRQAEEKKKEAKAKRQAEEKRKKEAEAKYQAEETRKREAEEKRKREAEAKRQAEEKKQREVQEAQERLKSDAESALFDLKGPIADKIYSYWTYFGEASALEVILVVKVSREGEVISSEVMRSSGDPRFDRSAENAVRKASPLPFPDNPKYYEFIKEFIFTGSSSR